MNSEADMTQSSVSEELDRVLTDHLDYYDDTVTHLRNRIIEAIAPRLKAEGMQMAKEGLPQYWQDDIERRADALSPPEPKP